MDERIREAVELDIPRIVAMGRRFLAEGPYAGQLGDNPEQALRFTKMIIGNPQARIFVSDLNGELTGLIAFILFPHHFSGDLTAIELIWYVEPEHRGQVSMELMWAAEKKAKEMGARFMQFTSPDAKASRIYERFGYKQIEVGYQKELKCLSAQL